MIDADLLEVFLPEARGYLASMAGGGPEERAHAAHGLKGACAMVGLSELAAQAEALEAIYRRGDDGALERARLQAALDGLADPRADALPPRADALPPRADALPPRADVAVPPKEPPPEAPPSLPEWDPDELRSLRAFFLDEAVENLEALGAALQSLRADRTDRAALASLMRKLHTLKGSAGSIGLDDLSRAAHALEDRLIVWRDRGGGLEPAELDELESSQMQLALMVAEVERSVRGAPEPFSPDAAPVSDAAPARTERRQVDRRAPGFAAADGPTVRVEVERIDELMDAASELVFDRTRLVRRLEELGGCARDVRKVRGALHGALGEIDSVLARHPMLRARLRGIIDVVAVRFGEIATELDDVGSSLERAVAGVAEDADGLARTSATLQERMRRVRMMSVGRLFARLEPSVREVARKESKDVVLQTRGEETEIDKAVVERVAEPLLHLLRNAVAHGIEPPAMRQERGKTPHGTISVSARHDGDATEIVVRDDGRGIDLDGVRRALVAARRASPEEAELLEEDALYDALFQPGVSTRVGADDVAGRGVGLDAVKDAISRLGGTVRVTSTPGAGAAFTVRLPLTTAVQQALLFKVGGQVYAVPAASVKEAATVTADDLRLGETEERVALNLRGQSVELPLVRLGALLGVPAPPGPTTRRSALIMTSGDETFAVTCDRVIGPREIVVRGLGPLLSALPLYAGATISGAGKVQLILDVTHLREQARRGVHSARPSRALGPRRVLVVDDSRSIREAASLILLQGGYAVEAVPDGWDAWELLQDRPFDVLVTDVEMPRLDGHELIARVRGSAELAALPIVVVSSRTADPMRIRLIDAGADGFVPKPLRRKVLLDAVDAALVRR
jgi:chemotaxis protein histidine kinase CheA/CheY-like chemotaxis protein